MNYVVEKSDMDTLAKAIQAKGGTSEPLTFPDGMAQAVEAISSGGGGQAQAELDAVADGSIVRLHLTAKTIRTAGFQAQKNLESVNAPELTRISPSGLRDCDKLSSLTAPKLERIETAAFMSDKTLSKIKLESIAMIDRVAFRYTGLSALILPNPIICKLNDKTALSDTPIAAGTGYIYVPKTLVEQYKAATNWVSYAKQFRVIEDYPEITGG